MSTVIYCCPKVSSLFIDLCFMLNVGYTVQTITLYKYDNFNVLDVVV